MGATPYLVESRYPISTPALKGIWYDIPRYIKDMDHAALVST